MISYNTTMTRTEYISKYNKANYYSFLLRIPCRNKKIIDKIESVNSINGYINELLENDVNPQILSIKFIKKISKSILSKYKISEIYLFGSYSRGEANKNSDVDILCEPGNISTLFESAKIKEELEESLGKKVDLLFTDSKFQDGFLESIKEDIIKLC